MTRLAYGWRMKGSKNEETLDFSRVSWCGKQDLNLHVRLNT